jgi:hypothetical protein
MIKVVKKFNDDKYFDTEGVPHDYTRPLIYLFTKSNYSKFNPVRAKTKRPRNFPAKKRKRETLLRPKIITPLDFYVLYLTIRLIYKICENIKII